MSNLIPASFGLDLEEHRELFDRSAICDDERNDVNLSHGSPPYSMEMTLHRLEADLIWVREQFTADVQTLRSRLDSLEARVDINGGVQDEHVRQVAVVGDQPGNQGVGPEGLAFERAPMTSSSLSVPSALSVNETKERECHEQVAPISSSRLASSSLSANETKERYCFGASTWNLMGLVGVNALGVGGSCVAAIVILMKIFMQLIFIGFVYFNFTTPPINQDVVDAAKAWRRRVGHQAVHWDAESDHSLVARVCAGDMSLEKSGPQADLYENIGVYLKQDASDFEVVFNGQALCLVALACWYLMVCREIHDALNWFRALVTLPRTSMRTRIIPFGRPKSRSTYKFENINSWRLRYCMVLLIYRLFIAALLLFCGTYFLVYTIEVTELVLNAVALEIILNIDELMFDSLASSAMRHLVLVLEPIDMDRWPHWKGMDVKAFVMTLLLPLSLVIVYATRLSPMVSELNAVADSFCGGNRDFVWVEDSLHMVWMAPTKAYSHSSSQISSSAKMNAVLEATMQLHPDRQESSRHAMWKNDTKSLELQWGYSFSEALKKLQPSCQDLSSSPALNYMRELVNVTIGSCRDISPWCTSVSVLPDRTPDNGKGILARALCPMTCGCADPSSSIFVHTGCPE